MPLLLDHTIEDGTRIGLWQIEESHEWFCERLELSKEETRALDSMKDHRKMEWLSSRWLVHLLSESDVRLKMAKDAFGKPHLENFTKQISLSHSKDKVAAIISEKSVGIDIEKIDEKIFKIDHKFISEAEKTFIEKSKKLDACHIFWGSKECMYKAYGKRELDFRKHMRLFPFKIFNNNIEIKGTVNKENTHQEYNIYAQKIKDFYLIYSILEHEAILSIDSHSL